MKILHKLIESSGSNHTLEFRANYILKYEQGYIDNHAFESEFDDYILFKNGWDVEKNIKRAVENDEVNLAEYVGDNLKNIVESIELEFDVEENQLRIICEVNTDDIDSVIEPLQDFISGQLSDGWGEGFEQEELSVEKIWCAYDTNNEDDCRFFATEREAQKYSEEMSYYADDDEDEEEIVWDYMMMRVSVHVSFWQRGYKPELFLIDGYDKDGYDKDGFGKDGFNRKNFDRSGFDREGFNSRGFNKEGFDRDGYDKSGLDKDGFDKSGFKDLEDSRPTRKDGKKAGALLRKGKDGKLSIKNTIDLDESRKRR